MLKRCYNCIFCQEHITTDNTFNRVIKNYKCISKKAFNNDRSLDSEAVYNTDEVVFIGLNFGCIHFEEKTI